MTHTTSEGSARGAAELVRFLEDHAYRHVFGLPGSSMVAALHQLQNSEVRYVSTIHESVTIAAADGYARVAGSGVAMIYMLPGVANGLGNLYNAWRDESPLLVLASQQASNLRTPEGTIGEHDIAPLVRPFTRLSRELCAGTPLRRWLEMARRAACGFPSGPSFLSLPEDVLEAVGPVVDERATTRVAAGGATDLAAFADKLSAARSPLLVVGGQVRRHGGAEWAEAFSARHGWSVAYEPGFNDRLSVAPGHPNLVGNLIGVGGAVAERAADVVLVVGARFLQEGHPRPGPYFPNAAFVAHVNADPAKLEETRVANWSCACNPAAFLRDLDAALPTPSDELLTVRRQAIERARAASLSDTPFARALASYQQAVRPLHDALERGWVVDEAVMGSAALVAALKAQDGRRYIGTAGGSLGWATGASVGVALASGEPVTCVLGDGALRFGLHGLWTAVVEKLPITFVVLDNGGYGSTRFFERMYVQRLGPDARPQRPSYSNMDLRRMGPTVSQLFEGFGVPCRAVQDGEDARAAIEQAWMMAGQGPNAVILPVPFEDEI